VGEKVLGPKAGLEERRKTMNYFTIYGAALLLALLIASPALDILNFKPFGDWKPKRGGWRSVLWDMATSELGVTITYLSKFTNVNTTTAPTAAQASQLTCQVAQISMTDAETQAIVVHNWGVLLGPSFATFGWPMPNLIDTELTAHSQSFATNFTFGLGNSNQVYVNKIAGAPGGTYLLYLFLPSSYMAKA
jgi:hypothetical protein